jgi:hypothetical protein
MFKDLIYNRPFMFSCKVFSLNDLNFFPEDVKDITPVRGQEGKISDTQEKDCWSPTRLRRVGDH